MNKHELWVDYTKAFACILVTLGHFLQSMIKSGVLSANPFFSWLEQTIYLFHVILFFICSGYIFQKYSKVASFFEWKNNIRRKMVSLGIPYIVFTLITWGLKIVFFDSVNDQAGSLWETIFFHPMAPYWYLYVLLFIFFITPTFLNKRNALTALFISFIMQIVTWNMPIRIYAVNQIMTYEIWFVFGMCLSIFDFPNMIKETKKIKNTGLFLIISFVVASIGVYYYNISSDLIKFLLSTVSSMAIVLIFIYVQIINKKIYVLGYIAKYSMPVFLMHTIFAAGLRTLLFHLNIYNPAIHICLGILASFGGPVIVARIMRRHKYMDFILYPGKYFR